MIPVKQGPPLASSSANMCTAVGLREEMRTIVLRDRDLHEKVRQNSGPSRTGFLKRINTGHKSVCFFRPGLLQA
jgi:hypothetical protein